MDDSKVMKVLRSLECLRTAAANQSTIRATKKTAATRYLLNITDLLQILSNEQERYHLVTTDLNLLKDIEIIYYDTSQLTFYRQIIIGGPYKLKIRKFTCVQSEKSYMEVIDYNNAQKSAQLELTSDLSNLTTLANPQVASFIREYLPTSPSLLEPVLGISYKQFELINRENTEHISISFNISFYNKSSRKYHEDFVIAEVKQTDSSKYCFGDIMQIVGAGTTNVSKYNLGFLMMYPTFDLTRFGRLHKHAS